MATSSIERAVQYFVAIRAYLRDRKSPYKAIVAFSGDHENRFDELTDAKGERLKQYSEAALNGFPSSKIADKIQEDPYRFLICADKFQTGYDEPLLHTMYVDKMLSGIKAVQTLSRLNRAHPQKHDTFVLDFMNDVDTIRESFADYYRATILSEETDPNKLHDLKTVLDGCEVYSAAQVDEFVGLYLGGAERPRLDPILDACVAVYKALGEDEQVDFKGKAKAFVRTYGFLAAIHECRLGEAVHRPELSRLEAARAGGRGPVRGNSRHDRHGQLPSREESRAAHSVARRGCGDRAGADQRRWTKIRASTRSLVEHHQGIQRPVRQHPVE